MGRVHVRSDVTVNSGAVPAVSPDWVVENGDNHPTPTIDGALDEQVWLEADSFVIRWNDSALRNSYPGAGPWRSGQFQPDLDTIPGLPPVLDSADAAIKMFFRDDWLYLGANVNDRLVQGVDIGSFDRIDGVRFIVGDRDAVDGDNRMLFRMLLAMFDANGNPSPQEYLQVMLDSTNSEFSIAPKGATTINNNSDVDEGFVVEMKLDLTYLGYPSGLGDNLLFMGVMLADGDSFTNPDNDYGTRTWWFREHNNGPAAAWMVMDPNSPVGIGDNTVVSIPETIELHGNYPNPFNPTTTIRYSTPIAGKVSLQVYNVLGQEVVKINSGKETAGSHELNFNAQSLSSGIYFYKIQVENPASGKLLNSKIAKMILLK
ncbi:MAG: T9SS type A sorting domain-containing protein [Aliifodinibius sp.]|nr:T9SS type A sorting domain-containing protein [Fodinibius sp.]NIW44908.1 T9SS type A sorting domain-containing protein [Gammaproteobacteria bacterium]NIW97961.1 T9SS type A sorting domain-containing protein [Phycisphaerae bacterium]NIY25626.1 T9SS type A sorting domain-containing protein [Fodinibius sp.]